MIEIELEKEQKRLRDLLIHVSKVVEIDNLQNHYDINILLESIFCGLFNLIFDGYQYKNLNTYDDKNAAGVDLGDDANASYFQVTSTPTQWKVNKSYKTFLDTRESTKTVYSLKFLILKIKARTSLVKLPEGYDADQITFDPAKDYLDFAKLLNIIYQLEPPKVDVCVKYLEQVVKDNPVDSVDLDGEFLRAFFGALNEVAAEEAEVSASEPSSSDIKVKEERLGVFWEHVYSCYKNVISSDQERKFMRAYNRLDEGARSGIEQFLKYNSFALLHKQPDAEKAFAELRELILKKINPFPISHSELDQYLFMEIVLCNVFPNPKANR